MTLEQVVTQNLRALRAQKKFSQETLAHKAGISVSYVSMLERGARTPPLATMEALAKAMGVSPLALLQKPSR
ncbi:MAG: transcriptional regulator [Anaeromyxobacter sp. RBG_16_69_14]|nr:MAG: transcriptional regulator [Anaeromyxobacter sp. RBG_16_69_14]